MQEFMLLRVLLLREFTVFLNLLALEVRNSLPTVGRFIQELLPKMKGMVYIPKVYHDMTTRKVLVTEWIEGEKLASSPKEVINKLTPVGIECFLCQLLETGH